jgi:hypothetical protein
MIARIQGKIVEKFANSLIVDVRGVGYEIQVPQGDYERLILGEDVTLHTYHHIREQSQDLFGFSSISAKKLFELLTTVQGITELKDVLWRELNDEENRVMTLTHRNLDERHRVEEEDNFDTGLERDESGDESGDDNFEEEDW